MIFLLIGAMPNRFQSNQVKNISKNWSLNGGRQLQYIQTVEHKKNIIFASIQSHEDRFGDWADFVTKIYNDELDNDPNKLIEWFQTNHPDLFAESF
jgi:hypothetical protein